MVEGNRERGRPNIKWIDDIKEWIKITQSDLMVKSQDRNEWRRHCIIASIIGYILRFASQGNNVSN